MIKSVIKFWGAEQDEYGIAFSVSQLSRRCFTLHSANDGVASVVSLSTGAPLSKPHYPVLKGCERAAFDTAVAALKSGA